MTAAPRALRIDLDAIGVEARIGVSEAEREVERPLLIDVSLTLADCAAAETDALADTVDYSAVAALAARTAREREHRTLERLAAEILAAIESGFDCERVWVRVAKPDPPMGERVERVAVELGERGR